MTVLGVAYIQSNCDLEDRSRKWYEQRRHRTQDAEVLRVADLRFAQARLAQDDSLGCCLHSVEVWFGKTGMRVARTASSSDAECIGPSCRRAFALLRLGSLRMTAWELCTVHWTCGLGRPE